jgi:hypothetical protein
MIKGISFYITYEEHLILPHYFFLNDRLTLFLIELTFMFTHTTLIIVINVR